MIIRFREQRNLYLPNCLRVFFLFLFMFIFCSHSPCGTSPPAPVRISDSVLSQSHGCSSRVPTAPPGELPRSTVTSKIPRSTRSRSETPTVSSSSKVRLPPRFPSPRQDLSSMSRASGLLTSLPEEISSLVLVVIVVCYDRNIKSPSGVVY